MTTILPIGTRVRSAYDHKLVGSVQGYGTLFGPELKYPPSYARTNPEVVYLVWLEQSDGTYVGSNSETGPVVSVMSIHTAEEV